MKKNLRAILTASTLLLLNTALNAQISYEWAANLGGTDDDRGYKVAVDASGNVYSIGHFRGTADFDPGAGVSELTSNGKRDVFISKLDADGNFVWAKQIGGTDNDAGFSIAVGGTDEVYITGFFNDTVDFDPGVGVTELAADPGGLDLYVAKLDGSGDLVWAKAFGGVTADRGYSLAVDATSKVYITGEFSDSVNFKASIDTISLVSNGGTDAFVLKLNALGEPVWASKLGGSGSDRGFGVVVDASYNVYCTGYFEGTADFDPGTGTSELTSVGDKDIFVVKLNSDGSLDWANNMGSSAEDMGKGIAVDDDLNVFVSGFFQGTADFDPVGTANLSAVGDKDVFVAKYNSSGEYVWANQIGGSGEDQSHALKLDIYGDVYVSGLFTGTVDFDPSGSTAELSGAGNGDVFISKYNTDGEYIWASRMGSSDLDVGRALAIDEDGYVYAAGFFTGTADLNPEDAGTDNVASAGSFDAFVVKFFNNFQTYIRDEDCGLETSDLSEIFYAESVSGATSYEFEFTNTSTLAVTTYETGTTSYGVSFSLAGLYDVGVTYDVRVRAQVNGSYGSYGKTCQVSAPSTAPTTSIRDLDCGITVADLDQVFYAKNVINADDYEFEFTNTSTLAVTEVTTGSSDRFMTFNTAGLTDLSVTYDVRVRAQVTGIWGEYAEVCQITSSDVSIDVPDTKLRDIDCGATMQSLDQIFYAKNVTDAEDYEFEFTNTTTLAVTEVTTGSSVRYLSLQSAGLTDFDVTYDVRVRAQIDGVLGEYSDVCQLTAPANVYVPVTRLRDLDCGITVEFTSTEFRAKRVTDATNYEFEFTNTSTLAVTEVTTGSSSRIMTLDAAGLTDFDVTYDVRVRAQVSGAWGSYDQVCQLTAPGTNVPDTRIRGLDCGITVSTLNSTFQCKFVTDATNYEFEFTNTSTLAVTEVTTGSSSRFMSLSAAGLNDLGVTYDVRVRAYIGASVGDYTTVCQISSPAAPTKYGVSTDGSLLTSSVYPNPSNGEYVGINMITSSEGASVMEIYNLAGELVHSSMVTLTSGENDINVNLQERLDSGVYFININGETMKFIVR